MSRPVALVIEKDPASSSLIKGLLEACGFAVHCSLNGLGGVAVAWRENPTLLTVNLQMPGLDGITAIRRIRRFSDAYILVVAESNEESDVVGALEAGADDYVAHPLQAQVLQARVEAVQRRPLQQNGHGLRMLS